MTVEIRNLTSLIIILSDILIFLSFTDSENRAAFGKAIQSVVDLTILLEPSHIGSRCKTQKHLAQSKSTHKLSLQMRKIIQKHAQNTGVTWHCLSHLV